MAIEWRTENEIEKGFASADAGGANRVGDKSKWAPKPGRNEPEPQIKSSRRPNPSGAQIERETKWTEGRDLAGDEIRSTMSTERDRAGEIERQTRAARSQAQIYRR